MRKASAAPAPTPPRTDASSGKADPTAGGDGDGGGSWLPSSWLTRSERDVLAISIVIKLLLWPCYHSTDFEVHRNWLAIAYTLPIRQWYFEAASQWTLDYPPFFAYLSWILAQPAPLFDPLIVSLDEGLEHAAWSAKAYMRATVMVTELVLGAALVAHSRIGAQWPSRLSGRGGGADSSEEEGGTAVGTEAVSLLAASLFLHPGLIIIDHIHFQYNGFLFGVLLWSLWAAREDRPLLCAFLFSSLLNLKHIYVYIAPPFVVYLLRSYIYLPGSQTSNLAKSLERLIILGAVTVAPFLASLLPLMVAGAGSEVGSLGVLSQVLSRLFPFSRGLIHAYWAPNAWALWTFADRALVKLIQRKPDVIRFLPHRTATKFQASAATGFAAASRGLVGHVSFAVLPDILPSTCFLLTLTCMLVYLVKLWQAPTYRSFLASISLCGFASFLFGWHVHEKAIMLVLIPYTFLAAEDYAHFRTFVILSTAGTVSLFPLLYAAAETPIKLALTLVWAMLVFGSLSKRLNRPVTSNLGIAVHALETAYLYGFVALQTYVSVFHPLLFPAAESAAVVTGAPSPVSSAVAAPAALMSVMASTLAEAAETTSSSAAYAEALLASATGQPATLDGLIATSLDVAAEMSTASPALAAPEPTAVLAVDAPEAASIVSPSDDGAPEVASTLAPSMEAEAVSIGDALAASMTSTTAPQKLAASSDLLQPPRATVAAAPSSTPPSAPLPGATTGKNGPYASVPPHTSMEFLPLMMVSVYCSVGVVWAWLRASSLYLATQY